MGAHRRTGSVPHGCPCGHYGDSVQRCNCTPHQIRKYLARISGPVLDRIDIHIEVPRLKPEELEQFGTGESSAVVCDRVCAARARQSARFRGSSLHCNADMTSAAVREFCRLEDEVASLLGAAVDQFGLSARAYDRILKVSRTIADLEGATDLAVHHVAEAVQYRALDRKLWA